ncbi:hypothetical protein Hypma_002336 [Hypsizygus marmoreus]|uniref:Uncharacterized protein n=1 Tax=Hypsizygus marmoreus TaxID=39966 RepID=A0A369K808_HYPMA|nr:hypothetical protein Hypma_002336 [Hypsizygus marmoreus]
MELLSATKSLRDPLPQATESPAQGKPDVKLIPWNGRLYIYVSAALRLAKCLIVASSPQRLASAPTLAVDLKVLDFVSSLTLFKRFSNALLWYNALQDATTDMSTLFSSMLLESSWSISGWYNTPPHIYDFIIPSRKATVEDVEDEDTPRPARSTATTDLPGTRHPDPTSSSC